MIALADNPHFRQGVLLVKSGIPYEAIFGPPKLWNRNMRNAATMILNDFREESGGTEDLEE